jgi:hypothetical protein
VECRGSKASELKGKIAFRGGTAIHKLLFEQPLRYSEDIDLVQTRAEPIGATVDAIRDALPWLGKCNRAQAGHSMHQAKVEIASFTPEELFGTKLRARTLQYSGAIQATIAVLYWRHGYTRQLAHCRFEGSRG